MNKYEMDELLYAELVQAAKAIEPYYDIDKIKSYSVYIWTKGDGDPNSDNYWGENVFDIQEDRLVFYVEDHKIPDDVMPIIQNIQAKIRAIHLNWESDKVINND